LDIGGAELMRNEPILLSGACTATDVLLFVSCEHPQSKAWRSLPPLNGSTNGEGICIGQIRLNTHDERLEPTTKSLSLEKETDPNLMDPFP
jgi:hypothetical protein